MRGRFDSAPIPTTALSPGRRATVRYLLAQRSALHLVAGGTIATLWGWGLMWWTPAFLDSRRVVWVMAAVIGLATIPSICAYWTGSRPLAIWALWAVVPAVYFFIGPTLSLLQNVMPASMPAQTVAILLFTANVANLRLCGSPDHL